YTKLASTLPPLLINFFRRHPPGSFSRTSPPTTSSTSSSDLSGLSSPPTRTHLPIDPTTLAAVKQAQNASNPFLPFLNPITRAWRPAQYSLRRQAELYNLAEKHGVMSLLPYTSPKNPVLKLERREKVGLRVRGTGAGQKVKGKSWERHLRPKLEAREKAMEGMSALVKEWKQRGHGRGWKKWPK
ncbi:hypothetical protein K461DRAFT_212834, partial [Myriangium duriaei CBS 260.36]